MELTVVVRKVVVEVVIDVLVASTILMEVTVVTVVGLIMQEEALEMSVGFNPSRSAISKMRNWITRRRGFGSFLQYSRRSGFITFRGCCGSGGERRSRFARRRSSRFARTISCSRQRIEDRSR